MEVETVFIETSRLRIRKCTEEDVDALQVILGDPEVMQYSLQGPLDREGTMKYLKEIMLQPYEEHGFGLWALIFKETDQLIGIAGLYDQRDHEVIGIELAYRIARKYWGMGFATEAAKAIKDYAFTVLNFDRLISTIEPDNHRSSRVAKKVGMHSIASTIVQGIDFTIYEVNRASES